MGMHTLHEKLLLPMLKFTTMNILYPVRLKLLSSKFLSNLLRHKQTQDLIDILVRL